MELPLFEPLAALLVLGLLSKTAAVAAATAVDVSYINGYCTSSSTN
jgi:hypothetical protein